MKWQKVTSVNTLGTLTQGDQRELLLSQGYHRKLKKIKRRQRTPKEIKGYHSTLNETNDILLLIEEIN